MSSRETPALTAAFQPTVMLMSLIGASGVSRWLGASQSSSQVSVPGTRLLVFGAAELDCTPPASTTRSMPAMMVAAAVCTAARPEAQCRLRATPGAFTRPASMAA
jgi:hypothetical protein